MQDESMALAVRETPVGWTNLAIGVPEVVFDETGAMGFYRSPDFGDLCDNRVYPPAAGTSELIGAIREYHEDDVVGKHIVVANGARQALLATVYALTRSGAKTTLAAPAPYWPSHRSAAKLFNLAFQTPVPGWWDNHVVYVNTAPNNPDGSFAPSTCDVWDAAYYTPAYAVRGTLPPPPKHTVSCWSGGKLLGLPGLRVGWLMTDEPELARLASEYVELTTSGVSRLSQSVATHTLSDITPKWRKRLAERVSDGLFHNLELLYRVLGLELPETHLGMFAWLPDPDGHLTQAFERAKILVSPGRIFGDSSRIRVSLGLSPTKFTKALQGLERELCRASPSTSAPDDSRPS